MWDKVATIVEREAWKRRYDRRTSCHCNDHPVPDSGLGKTMRSILVLCVALMAAGCASIPDSWRRGAVDLVRQQIEKELAKRTESADPVASRWQGKQNVLTDPGTLIVWQTPDGKGKRVYQYDSGYYDPRSMDSAAVAERHWQGISDVAERAGHPQFRSQSPRPVAYTVVVHSWFNPHGVRTPDVTLHEMHYDKGYSIRWEIGNSRDHFGAPGSAHGYIVSPSGEVVSHMDVNHNRATSLRY